MTTIEAFIKALIKYVSSVGRPIRPVPTPETPCERKVRLLEDTKERLQLCEKAKMIQNDVHFTLLFYEVERMLGDAKRELEFERGRGQF